jgi:hypothetical protein
LKESSKALFAVLTKHEERSLNGRIQAKLGQESAGKSLTAFIINQALRVSVRVRVLGFQAQLSRAMCVPCLLFHVI